MKRKKNKLLSILSLLSLSTSFLLVNSNIRKIQSNFSTLKLDSLNKIDNEGFIKLDNEIKNLKDFLNASDTKISSYNWRNGHLNLRTSNFYGGAWTQDLSEEFIYGKGLWYYDGLGGLPNEYKNQYYQIAPTERWGWIGDWGNKKIWQAGFRFNFFHLDTTKYSTQDGGNNQSVYILNQYSNIKEDYDGNHKPWKYLEANNVASTISDTKTRETDFYGVDLFKSWSNSFANRPSRFGKGSIGYLPVMNFDDFKNLEFNLNLSAKFIDNLYSNPTGIYSTYGGGNRAVDVWNNPAPSGLNSQIWRDYYGWQVNKISNFPHFDEINRSSNNLITSNQKKYSGIKLYTKISSFKIWLFYYLHKQSDELSFDVCETILFPLSAKLELYASNESQLEIVNNIAKALSSNNFFSNNKKFMVDDGAISLSPKFNDSSLLRPSLNFNDKVQTTFNKYLEWQENNWTNLKNEFKDFNFDNELLKLNYEIILNSEATNNQDYRKGKLYLCVESNGKKYYYFIKTISFSFEKTPEYQNWIDTKSIHQRLKLIPSNWFRYDNGKYIYATDEPIVVRKENINSDGSGDGGEFIYHGPVNLIFTTTSNEDEILYVNDSKVDVLNQQFEFNLKDLIKKNDQDNLGNRENKYVIKIVKYNQNNGVNVSEKIVYQKTIIIQSYIGENRISYFAWNPEFNSEQKKLIEQYLWDPATGEVLKDRDGNPILNPSYNPNINPDTGTIKQLIWVNKKSENNEIIFIPDPLDEKGNLNFNEENFEINENNFGFIAEAVVIPKGITISDPNSNFIDKNLRVAKIANLSENNIDFGNDPIIKNWNNLEYGNENTYLSSGGIYVFSDYSNKNLSCIKMVGYGTSDTAYKKFVDEYKNYNQYGWANLWDTYQGIHLLSFLKDKKSIDNETAKTLSYQEIIYYWKEYVSAVFDSNIKYRPTYQDSTAQLDNVFENFPNEINIFNSGLNEDVIEVKKFILNKVLEIYNLNCNLKYKFEQDWNVIFPSDEELIKLAKMEYENINPNPFFTTLQLKVLKETLIGNKIVKIKNVGSKKPNIVNNDLTNIEIRNYVYELNDSITLQEQFIKDLSFDLMKDYNLIYGEFVVVENIEQKIKSLFYQLGTNSIILKLIPLDKGVNGFKLIKLTNTTTSVEKFDLSNIKIERLSMQLTNKNEIYQAIEKHINKYLGEFSFYQNGLIEIIYQDDKTEIKWNSDQFLKKLIMKNPPAWTIKLNLIIKSNHENIIGTTNFNVANRSGDQPFDPDTDQSWNPDYSKYNSSFSSITFGVLGTTIAIGIIVLVIFGLKWHFKNSSKKIK